MFESNPYNPYHSWVYPPPSNFYLPPSTYYSPFTQNTTNTTSVSSTTNLNNPTTAASQSNSFYNDSSPLSNNNNHPITAATSSTTSSPFINPLSYHGHLTNTSPLVTNRNSSNYRNNLYGSLATISNDPHSPYQYPTSYSQYLSNSHQQHQNQQNSYHRNNISAAAMAAANINYRLQLLSSSSTATGGNSNSTPPPAQVPLSHLGAASLSDSVVASTSTCLASPLHCGGGGGVGAMKYTPSLATCSLLQQSQHNTSLIGSGAGLDDKMSHQDETDGGEDSDKYDKRARKDRPKRRPYSRYQLTVLESEYINSEYISRQRRWDIACRLNLSERQIKVWFQNRRMKEKKLRER